MALPDPAAIGFRDEPSREGHLSKEALEAPQPIEALGPQSFNEGSRVRFHVKPIASGDRVLA